MKIGPINISSKALLAPMAGVTDKPFRLLCKELGAGYAVSEMTTSDPRLWSSRKSLKRMDHEGEPDPIGIQMAGADPAAMAEAARFNVDRGAQIIDLNFCCPAKKVVNGWCGSALLQDEPLASRIIESVVSAVDVPVTLKMRTGWNAEHRNAVRIAQMAESAGIAMIAVHGRTREMLYEGVAEYNTVAEIKSKVHIPVVANGDIDSPAKARQVLDATKADAVMIGRPAQGRPWIFREINHFLATGELLPEPSSLEVTRTMRLHMVKLYEFYGEDAGIRIARKHLGWYAKGRGDETLFRTTVNRATSASEQLRLSDEYFANYDSKKAAARTAET
jgi:tRNA-dihydrouridine synthase B